MSRDAALAHSAPLRAAGFRVVVESPEAVAGNAAAGLWWIVNGAAGSVSLEALRDLVAAGNAVLLDGPSPLSTELLGLKAPGPSSPTRVRAASMRGVPITWDADIAMFAPTVPGRTLATTSDGTPALYRHRNVLWSMPRLDEGAGLRRFPYLMSSLREEFGIEPMAERRELDLFVDPDLEAETSVHDLAARWASNGVRRVYVAAWKDNRLTGARYDYGAFVAAMHRQGIQAYAWLSWPHVNSTFWKLHPGCREWTGADEPARLAWREAVAVEVPQCFEQAWHDTKLLLESAPFDGVNVSDLSFGRTPPSAKFALANETPFHPSARAELARAVGVDPTRLGETVLKDPARRAIWDTARQAMLIDVHAKLLARLRGVAAGKQLMVSLVSDGSLLDQMRSLQSRIPFELQVQEGSVSADRAALVDVRGVHVVDRAGPLGGTRMTRRARGLELVEMIAGLSESGQRLALHESNSIARVDLGWARFALAAGTTIEDETGPEAVAGALIVDGPRPIRLRLVRPAKAVEIDGKTTLLSGQRGVAIPAGRHRVVLH